MTGEAPSRIDDVKTLDPAAENVRRKLKRFMFINLGILFAALMAVMIALVYKTFSTEPAGQQETQASSSSELMTGNLLLPSGAEIVTQSLSGNRLALHVRRSGGGQSILVYDLNEQRLVGRYELGWQGE